MHSRFEQKQLTFSYLQHYLRNLNNTSVVKNCVDTVVYIIRLGLCTVYVVFKFSSFLIISSICKIFTSTWLCFNNQHDFKNKIYKTTKKSSRASTCILLKKKKNRNTSKSKNFYYICY